MELNSSHSSIYQPTHVKVHEITNYYARVTLNTTQLIIYYLPELSNATLKSSALPLLLLLEKNSAATATATSEKK